MDDEIDFSHGAMAQWVSAAIAASGKTNREVSAYLKETLGPSGVSEQDVGKMQKDTPRWLRAREMLAISKFTGFPVPGHVTAKQVMEALKEGGSHLEAAVREAIESRTAAEASSRRTASGRARRAFQIVHPILEQEEEGIATQRDQKTSDKPGPTIEPSDTPASKSKSQKAQKASQSRRK